MDTQERVCGVKGCNKPVAYTEVGGVGLCGQHMEMAQQNWQEGHTIDIGGPWMLVGVGNDDGDPAHLDKLGGPEDMVRQKG